jgi:holliday junction DNA helicase RuvA
MVPVENIWTHSPKNTLYLEDMIGAIEGEVIYNNDRTVIFMVGGVGYTVGVTTQTALRLSIGEKHRLWTHLSVREDALDLYGFSERNELELFKLLIGVSGIGPKSGLNVLSLADVPTLLHAIEGGDGDYLTKVSGIGKKLGQKIIIELKDKVALIPHESISVHHAESEALEALEALGYAPRDIREIVRTLTRENDTTQDIIRKALQHLSGRQ